MNVMCFRTVCLATVFSFPVLFSAIKPAAASGIPYVPALGSGSAYQLSFMSADENNFEVSTYENDGGQWKEFYYDYSYQINGCSGSVCNSGNRINANRNGMPVTEHFYGLANSAVNNTDRSIGALTGDFINNKSNYGGGAIDNSEDDSGVSRIGDITGDFINNKADMHGGAIVNTSTDSNQAIGSAIIGNITGNFIGNAAEADGGAIYNDRNSIDKTAQIGNITGDFIANSVSYNWGGAIFNNGKIGDINGNFISNSAYEGGAFMNTGEMGEVKGNFLANTAEQNAGAIYLSNYSKIGKIEGNFVGNKAGGYGGAIVNTAARNLDLEGDFISNQAQVGGAIANYANPDAALYPSSATITNSNFFNNRAEKAGGAIYNNGTISIVADNYNSVFQGNTANGTRNAIFSGNVSPTKNEPGTVNLIVQNNGSLSFYDDIDGDVGHKINLAGDGSGTINFHANVINGDIVVGNQPLTRAVSDPVNVNFDNISNLSNRNNSLIMNDGKLTFDDFALTQHHFRELKLNGGEVNINNVNVDLANTAMGRFTADGYTGGNTTVKVHNLNVVSDNENGATVDFADTSFSHQVENHITAATGPVYDYQVAYLPESGQYTFQRAKINEEVKVPSYAAIAAASILSDEIYSRVLSDADSYFDNSSSSAGVKPFVKAFGSDDKTDLKHFTGGDSKYYGAIAGLETNSYEIGAGWKAVYNAYLAYAKGEHKFSYERVDQETGYIGASAILYKDNFFVGSTINAGIVENTDKGLGDKNKFTSYLGGIGLKTGYNYALGSDYVVQPNLYASYTYINSNDYKTRRNARVKFDDMSNYELAPGLKLSKKFGKGLELYAKGRYVFVFNDGQNAKADDVYLPDVELKNYAEFGVGAEKNWSEDGVNSFFEITRREGGREGWNGLAGVKLAF